MSKSEKEQAKIEKKKKLQEINSNAKKEEREAVFQAPAEPKVTKESKKEGKKDSVGELVEKVKKVKKRKAESIQNEQDLIEKPVSKKNK